MKREEFIQFLKRSSPEEVLEFIAKKGKRKKVCPIIEYPEDMDPNEILDNLSKARGGK